ncbi:hypothetical protein BSKO_09629 [Bryopsis sp. KO-2023]|nr:hypothetical protein BSKO_09629 [Bryopsis sp. KO-2023]
MKTVMNAQRAFFGLLLLFVVGSQGGDLEVLRERVGRHSLEVPSSTKAARVTDVNAVRSKLPEVPSPAEQVEGCKLAIVGAGYGGLYFAYRIVFDEEMVAASDVCIFEASTRRIGGRVYSLRNLLGDPELVVDVGGYRYVPSQKLIAKLIEERLGLNTRCYYPLTCEDARRIIVDESGLNQLGYVAPVETMLEDLVKAGSRVFYGYKLTGVFDLSGEDAANVESTKTGGTPVELKFENGGSAVVDQVMLNIPSEAIATLDGRSILFQKQSKAAQGGYMISDTLSLTKIYVEYEDAWWITKLGLIEGTFEEPFDPKLEGRYHDGPARCFDKNNNQIPLDSEKEMIHKCNGALMAAYFGFDDQSQEKFYTAFKQGDDPLSIFEWDESADGFDLIQAVHNQLMNFHSQNFTNAGFSAADIDPPLYLYMGNWGREDPIAASAHEWTLHLPGTTIAKTTKALLRPAEGYDVFIANEAYGVSPGWAEGSIMMAERVLAYELGVGKPAWLNDDQYYRDVVKDLDFFDLLTVQLYDIPLPKSNMYS